MVTVSVHPSAQTTAPHGPTVGFAAQLALLAVLATTTGLGGAGWFVGTTYALAVCAMLGHALRRSGARSLGPANQVTLARATLVGGVAALVAESLGGPVPIAVVVALAAVALLLDGVDGKVARRTGTASTVGARFDMEVDAFLILVLSVFVAQDLGIWVLAIGLTRYAFVAASFVLPWLTAPLPPAMWRKTVAAVQGIVLTVAASGLLPRLLAVLVVALALASLTWSFGRDIRWLWRRHRAAAARVTPSLAASSMAATSAAAAEPSPTPTASLAAASPVAPAPSLAAVSAVASALPSRRAG